MKRATKKLKHIICTALVITVLSGLALPVTADDAINPGNGRPYQPYVKSNGNSFVMVQRPDADKAETIEVPDLWMADSKGREVSQEQLDEEFVNHTEIFAPAYSLEPGTYLGSSAQMYSSTPDVTDALLGDDPSIETKVRFLIENAENIAKETLSMEDPLAARAGRNPVALNSVGSDEDNYRIFRTATQLAIWNVIYGIDLLAPTEVAEANLNNNKSLLQPYTSTEKSKKYIAPNNAAYEGETELLNRTHQLYEALVAAANSNETPLATIVGFTLEIDESEAVLSDEVEGFKYYGPLRPVATLENVDNTKLGKVFLKTDSTEVSFVDAPGGGNLLPTEVYYGRMSAGAYDENRYPYVDFNKELNTYNEFYVLIPADLAGETILFEAVGRADRATEAPYPAILAAELVTEAPKGAEEYKIPAGYEAGDLYHTLSQMVAGTVPCGVDIYATANLSIELAAPPPPVVPPETPKTPQTPNAPQTPPQTTYSPQAPTTPAPQTSDVGSTIPMILAIIALAVLAVLGIAYIRLRKGRDST